MHRAGSRQPVFAGLGVVRRLRGAEGALLGLQARRASRRTWLPLRFLSFLCPQAGPGAQSRGPGTVRPDPEQPLPAAGPGDEQRPCPGPGHPQLLAGSREHQGNA